MQTQVNPGQSTRTPAEQRPSFVNEMTHANTQVSISKPDRPHILQRRAARWARRDR